jgi:hypothetical protein
MDEKPFFTFRLDAIRPADLKTLEKFSKASFDLDQIVQEAGNLKLQTLIRREIEREFAEPSPEFVRILAGRVHEGRLTSAVKENFGKLVAASISGIVRDLVSDRSRPRLTLPSRRG